MEVPKKLLQSVERKEMWKQANILLKKLSKILDIEEAYLTGSFSTKKKRPADVDTILLLQTKTKNQKNWSLDIQISPNNVYGKKMKEDVEKWMNQKYGKKGYTFITLK